MTRTEEITFGVYQHSSGPQGGFIPRTRYDGWAPAPYSQATPVKVYKRLSAAERHCDRLNGREGV